MSIIIHKLQNIRWLRSAVTVILFMLTAYMLGKMALDPSKVRLLIASSLMIILFAFSQRKPAAVLYLLLLYLPFLGFIRRVLIPVSGWNTMDPFVILGPLMILLLVSKWVYDTYLRRIPIADDTRLFRLIRWMVLVDLIQVLNPIQGSLFTGFAGVMFYIVPVCYMILSRQYVDEKRLKLILGTVYGIGLLAALYGYKQYYFGFFSFEDQWVELSGYTALKVYSVIRPISFFTSASEYAHYLGIAAVIGWVYFLKGKSTVKLFALAGVAFLYTAMFIESARGIIVTATAAITIISICSVKKWFHRLLIALVACAALTGMFFGISKLNTENDLIYHSVVGLTDPFGEESTTLGHLELMVDGFKKGIMNPLGHGLGSTTIAAGKFNSMMVSSEVDLSNKFLSTGIVGGILYLLIMIRTLYIAFKQANLGGIHLMILGVLLTEGGQWLNGGHYSTVGLIWIMIGFLDKTFHEKGKTNCV